MHSSHWTRGVSLVFSSMSMKELNPPFWLRWLFVEELGVVNVRVKSGFGLFVHRGVISGLFVVFSRVVARKNQKGDFFLNRTLKKGVV